MQSPDFYHQFQYEVAYYYYTFDTDARIIRPKRLTREGKPEERPRDMTACGCLGLVLMWYCTRGSCARSSALMFGQTSTPLYKWLKFCRKVLLHVLTRDSRAKVKLSSSEQVNEFQQYVGEKYLHYAEVWGAGDGIKLFIEPPQSYMKQLRYYNGWKAAHFISCVFVFSVSGKNPGGYFKCTRKLPRQQYF